MIRLHFVVEGSTEELFVNKVIGPYLAMKDIFCDACRVLTGMESHREDLKYKGGAMHFDHFRNHIRKWIRQDNKSDCRWTTMIDLYAIPDDFPGYRRAFTHVNGYEKVKVLEEEFAESISDRRFVPYVQLHEFESLLFTNLDDLKKEFLEKDKEIDRLAQAVIGLKPEEINSGHETAPSKRIIKTIPAYARNKTIGAECAGRIGIEKLKTSCPHFRQWVEQLERLNIN